MNWRAIGNWSLVGAAVMLVVLLLPAAQCAWTGSSATRLGGLTEDGEFHDWMYGRHDSRSRRRGSATRAPDVPGEIAGAVVSCFREYTPFEAPPWQQALMLGLFFAGFAMRTLDRGSYRNQVSRGEAIRSQAFERVTAEREAVRSGGLELPSARRLGVTPAGGQPQVGPPGRSAGTPPRGSGLVSSGTAPVGSSPPSLHEAFRAPGALSGAARPAAAGPLIPPAHSPLPPRGSPEAGRGAAWAVIDDSPDASRAARAVSGDHASARLSITGSNIAVGRAADTGSHPPAGVDPAAPKAGFAWDMEFGENEELFLPEPSVRIGASALAPTLAAATEALELDALELPPAALIGQPLHFRLTARNARRGATRIRLQVAFVDDDLNVDPLWAEHQDLESFPEFDSLVQKGQSVFTINRERFGMLLSSRLREKTVETPIIRLSVSSGDQELFASTALRDTLTVQFQDLTGTPVPPMLFRLRAPGGREFLGSAGSAAPGRVELTGVPPGRYHLDMLDGTPVEAPGGRPASWVQLVTLGLGELLGALPSGFDRVHRITAHVTTPIYVGPLGPLDGAGTADAPLPSVNDAVARIARLRASADPAIAARYRFAEIRLVAGDSRPRTRGGIVRESPSGDGPWLNWWRGHHAYVNVDWTSLVAAPDLTRSAWKQAGLLLQEMVHLHEVRDLRIVNAAYAEERERLASERIATGTLDEAYGELPMATLAASGGKTPFIVVLDGCRNVSFEGIQFLGEAGASGVAVTGSSRVRFHRCWVEFFAAGPLGNSDAYAAGRAFRIERSGSGGDEDVVAFSMCDIGWNQAARPGAGIAGAAIAVYGSRVHLTRCFLHDNRSTEAPADLVYDAASRLTGDASNHRSRNVVVPG